MVSTRPTRTALLGVAVLVIGGLVSLGCGQRQQTGSNAGITADLRREVPRRVGDWIVDAQKAYRKGRFRLALRYLDSAETEVPELADTYFIRGKIFTRLKQFTRADSAYHEVLDRDPEYPGVRLNLGINDLRTKDLKSALEWFRRERGVRETSKLFLEMGRAYQDLGRADSAEWAYRRAIDLDSTNATAYMWLGQLLEERGEVQQAIDFSRRALTLKPSDPDYQYVLGVQLLQSGKTERALDLLRSAAAEMPWHHGAQYNMGRALSRMGREEEAETYYVRADSAQQMQARIQKVGGQVDSEPQDPLHWARLGDVLRKTGRLQDAREAYQVAAALAPGNLGVHINLANLYVATGDTAQGAARYRRVLQIDSTLSEAWLNLGSLYAALGRKQAARTALRRALHGEANHAQARRYLQRLSE